MQYPKLVSPFIALSLIITPTSFVWSAEPATEQIETNPEVTDPATAPPSDGEPVTEPATGEAVPGEEGASTPEQAPVETVDSVAPESVETDSVGSEAGEAAKTDASETSAPPVEEGPERPTEPQIGGKPAKGKGMMIAGGTLLGVGAAGLAASIVLTQCEEIESTVGCKNNPHRKFVIPGSGAVVALGALLLAFGVVNHVKYRRWEKWTPGREAVVVPTLLKDGAGFSYAARF